MTGVLVLGVNAVEEIEVAMTKEVVEPTGIIAQEERIAEEEKRENLDTEALAQEVKVAAEEEELTITEVVGPAMERDENSAQRPKVMGGLL